MNGMGYEYFVRKVYNCERDYRRGADAAIYRKLETAETDLTSGQRNNTQEQKERDYLTAFSEVKKHVFHAVTDGMEKVRLKISKEEKEILQTTLGIISRSNFFNKRILDDLISGADKIFNVHGLASA